MRYYVHVGEEQREIDIEPGGAEGTWSVKLAGRAVPVTVRKASDGALILNIDGQRTEAYVLRARGGERATVCFEGQALEVTCRTGMEEQLAKAAEAAGEAMDLAVRTSMPGKIVDVKVKVGDVVAAGQTLVILEAMKMENAINAKGAARVKAVLVKAGQAVESGALLVELESQV